MTFPRRVAALACALILPSLHAAPVSIGDFSFEGNGISAGGFNYNLGPEWQESNGPGNGAGFEEYISGFSAEGTDHLGMELNHDVWQDLAVTYQANTRYTLTVAAGRRSGSTQSGNQSTYLLADSTGTIYATGIHDASALPLQTFGDAPELVFNTPDNPAAIGKTVRILLQARGVGRSHFDNIRLEATTLIPPGTATVQNLPPSSVTTGTATLNGQVTDIGDGVPSITIFWGPADGGTTAAAWANSAVLPGPQSGAYSTGISGLAPATTCFFTTRATNSAGDSWAVATASFETPPLPPAVVNIAASDILPTAATVGAQVTASGGEVPSVTIYYGNSDGGTVAGDWASSVALGQIADTATTPLSGLAPGATWYYRAFASNSGGSAWASATASFATPAVSLPVVENRSAQGITGTTASLRGEVTADGGDPPVVTIFHGPADGGTNPAAWASSAPLGSQSGEYSYFVAGLSPQTTYYFRSRAVNGAGSVWAAATLSFATTPLVPNTAVINEIHYKPADKTRLEEFIEIHNPGDTALNLSGWTLSDAVAFTFPGGTTLAAGGFLVVAENPAVILSRYGKTALGPWTGKLNSSGERIDLRDSGGVLKDSVNYGVGFPWPTAPDGSGGSAELIHPGLDNDLGGSWRASGASVAPPATYIAAGAMDWKYKKGTTEASNPVTAWRGTSFNDSGWLSGQAGIGYNDPGVVTTLPDMSNGYRSVYFRKSFTVPADDIPDQLKLRVRVDDGCVVWINGSPVHRINVDEGQLAHNYLAPFNHENVWEEITLNNVGAYLFGGTNVIAVHAFNTTLGSSDFSMDLELASAGGPGSSEPTPGAANSVRSLPETIPPQIRQVMHTPVTPAPGQVVKITARITDPNGMNAVNLSYQTVDPGSYIRLTDAAYGTAWTSVLMRDNGTNGDLVANDSIYSANLPAGVQTNRRLVRYRITFADDQGNLATVPYADDEQPNFAYYVYSGLPSWQGAFRPGTTPLQTFTPALLDDLPVYSLIANGSDVIASQYSGGSDAIRFRGTFVYDGKVYDHIEFKNRGEASTYVSGKNKWRFFFNRARDLPAKSNFGEDYSETWGSFSGDACASPWASLHRGMAGVEEASSYKLFQLGGLPSPHTHYYHFRVVRGATETPAAGSTINDPIGNADGQYAGDFWGLYLAIEQPDGSFLDERGLPDGSIYKIEGNAGDKKNQGITQPVDSSDWNIFRDAHVGSNPSEAWWRQNMDMESYYTFHALNRLTGNVDLRGGFNHYFYHRSTDNRWVPMPWDLDMMFIAKSHWSTNVDGASYPGVIHAYKALLQNPALALEYRNRAREILDLLASDATPGGGQVGQLFHEFSHIVNPTGQALTWADADAAMWNLHPRTPGGDGNASGQTNHRGNFYRTAFNDSRMGGGWTRWLRTPGSSGTMEHEDSMAYLRDYATNAWAGGFWSVNNGDQLGYGYQYLASDAADSSIPQTPVVTAAGDPAYPTSDLRFTSSAFSDPEGAGTYAKTRWRVSEISGPGVPGYTAGTPRKYEVDSIWTTELSTTPGTVTIPYGITQPGKTYRVRVRHQDSSGRWSHWSAPAQFAATEPPAGDLLHYWNFNPANFLVPNSTIGGGQISSTVSGAAQVIQHDAQDQGFAALNARNGDIVGSHLRVNNPLGATLTFAIPTTGHENIVVKYETRRSGQGAGTQAISYALDGSTFVPFATLLPPDGSPTVQILDFRNLTGADDNPLFAIRIAFQQSPGGTAGNNRFDNLTVEGDPFALQPGTYAYWRAEGFPNPVDQANDSISGPDANPSGDGIANILRYAFGVGPYEPVAHLMPVLAVEGGAREFRFRYDAEKTDLVWRVKASNGLDEWPSELFDSESDPIPPLEDGWLGVEVPPYLGAGPGADPRIFVRLQVEIAE